MPEPQDQHLNRNLEQLLKVAFIYNFAKFTTWPDSVFADPKAPITFCVIGKHEFGTAFDSVQGKSVGGRPVVVKYLSSYRDKDECQLVYVAPSEKSRLPKILSTSKEIHALTVSIVAETVLAVLVLAAVGWLGVLVPPGAG